MSKFLLLMAAAAMLAAAPAVANPGPERAPVPAPAVEAPAPERAGGQCFAVPAECASGGAADILLLANSCTSDCNNELQDCYDACGVSFACRNTCDTDYSSCTADC